MTENRISGFDFLRVVSCFMVVVLHAAAANFYAFGPTWQAANFYESISRFGVPVFFMISGALLLTREQEPGTFYRKRLARVLAPVVSWSLLYMLWNSYNGLSYGGFWGGLKAVLQKPAHFHLWYLYCIVGLYLFAPFLGKIYRHSDWPTRRVFLLLCFFVAAIMPLAQMLFGLHAEMVDAYSLHYFSGYAGYFFLGAYLHDANKNKNFSYKRLYKNGFLYLSASALIMISTWLHSRANGAPNEFFYQYSSVFVVLSAIFFFNALYALPPKLLFLQKQIRYLSSLTLGIYCVHVLVLEALNQYWALSFNMGNPWWSIPATALIAFCLSALIAAALHQTPLLRRVI